MLVWPASSDVVGLMNSVRERYHLPRLEEANIALSFNDSKPFVGGRFNWGKTSKFSPHAKVWHPKDSRYDFQISLPSDAWHSVLDGKQREAWLDLHLSRCQVEYVPETAVENGKKVSIKDEWGRVQYTDEIRRDDEGNPRWKLDPLDLNVFQENVLRYGCWCPILLDFGSAVHEASGRKRPE